MPSKKQKKKTTKKAGTNQAGSQNASNNTPYGDDDDSDGIPPLEPATLPNQTRTGLSPELESVHLSTTASLDAMTNATAEQLGKTAQDLYRGLEKDTIGMGIPEDSDYWLSLPPTIKTFVQNAYAQGVFSGTGTEPERAQQMYNVAQQMIQTGQFPRVSPGKGNSAPYPPGAYPAFDASVFSDPAFTQALEQLMPPNGPRFGMTGQGAQGAAPTSGDYIDGFTSEDEEEVEVDVDVVNGRADTITGTHVTVSYDANGGVRKMTATNYTGNVPMPAVPPAPPDPKKGKKKQKKAAPSPTPTIPAPPTKATPTVPVPPTPVAPPPVPVSIPAQPRPAPVQTVKPDQATPTAPPARQAPNPAVPPPSSRAAGKQPMAYPQNAPNSTLPPRSARASGKAPATTGSHYHHHPSPPASTKAPPGKPRPPAAPVTAKKSGEKLWNTSTQEERERIKEFWLGLKEEERKNLVKLEKDAVLKKMKEQQRHSCSCAVCGRKRTAIEAELEVLYQAYYEELKTYAGKQQQHKASGGKIPAPLGPGPFPGSVEIDNSGAVIPNDLTKHPAPPIHPDDYDEDDEDDEDDYDGEGSEEGSEEDEEDEETEPLPAANFKSARRTIPPQNQKVPPGKGVANGTHGKRGTAASAQQDFFTFGPNLTAAGNIITVADDLLKNDGQKFLEMMEQLAERRMGREEASAEAIMSDEESDEDDESDEESGSEDDEDDEDEDEDDEIMTEEQKMEEGRRMFSIFAARMFEQRVLHAYRERVAQDRQNQLLRELEEEDKAAADREAKRQKENARKKEKKKAQKEAKDEAAARRAAEKAAEDAAAKEKKRAEEDEARRTREEERARKEAEKRVKEEERLLREMEKRKRLAEEKEKEKEREAERKRKEREERDRQREEKERTRKEREEKERQEKERQRKLEEERAAVEAARLKEEAAKREQEEKERREREAQEAAAKKIAEEKANAEKAAAVAAAVATASRNAARANGQAHGKKPGPKPSSVPGPSSSAGPSNAPGLMRPGSSLSIPAPHPARTIQPPGPSASQVQRRSTIPNPLPQPLPPNAIGSSSHTPFPHVPPGIGFGPPSPIAPLNFGPGPSPYAMQGSLPPQQSVPTLQPSPLPRGFGQNVMGANPAPGPAPIQTDFHPPVPQPQQSPYQTVPPIGPPARGVPSPTPLQLMSPGTIGPPTSTAQNFSPGPAVPTQNAHSRRSSLDPGPIGSRVGAPAFGAITRPIAPIGTRPGPSLAGPSSASSSMALGGPMSSGASASSSRLDGDDAYSKGSGDLTGSPERLGSSALLDPDDEALPSAGGRRVQLGGLGSVWGPAGIDTGKGNPDGRFNSWNSFNSPGPNSSAQISSPMSATPWSMNAPAAPGGNWPSSGAPLNRGTAGFGGLPPPPNLGAVGMGAAMNVNGGSIGTPFLQGNFGFPPGAFGAPGNPSPGRQTDASSAQ